MSTRPWAFQQGVLWSMELARAPGDGAAAATRQHPQGAPEGKGAPSSISRGAPAPGAAAQGTSSAVPALPASFEETGPEAAAELARAMALGEASEVARRFANGRRCFVGRRDGVIVTYAWLSLQREAVGELEREYRLPPGEAYIWDCATLPAHRGGGLYGGLLCAVVATLAAEGQRRAWIGANLENEPSLRAFARAGFQPVVRVAYARLARLRCMRLWAQPGATGALVEGARAMLTEPYERAWRSVIFGVQPGRR